MHLLKYVKFKYQVDKLIAFILIIFLIPVFLLISFLILITMGNPIVFRQLRPGLKSKPFYIYKFRTLKNLFNKKGELLKDSERKTYLGEFLRSTSLDELLELINIVKGDMSFIGPRPLLMEYLPLYTDKQSKRHDLKPGLTGFAQVNGRNLISWEKKFELDCFYVENLSFILDIKIIFKTIFKIIKREGINSKDNKSVIKFTGSKSYK